MEDVHQCVPVTQIPPPPRSNNKSEGPSCPACGQPINPGTGNMWHDETDYVSASPGGLSIRRTYNSSPYDWDASAIHGFGVRWTSEYDASISLLPPNTPLLDSGICWRREDTKYVWCESPIITDSAPPMTLRSAVPAAVSVSRGDGKKLVFKLFNNTWTSDVDISLRLNMRLSADSAYVTEWTLTSDMADATETFDADGRLLSIRSRNGTERRLTYSGGTTNNTATARMPVDAPVCSSVQTGPALAGGVLMCVTDTWGHQLNFEHDRIGRIVKILDQANQAIRYVYDGVTGGCPGTGSSLRSCWANNLVAVTYPGGASKTYSYNEASNINGGVACPSSHEVGGGFGALVNLMTGLSDENGTRHISWTYDCMGNATSSLVGSGKEKVVLAYGPAEQNGSSTTTVTHYLGDDLHPSTTVTQYSYGKIVGAMKNTSVSQPCAECGPYSARRYDGNANITSTTDWKGNINNYTYDMRRNLETKRIEAVGTPQARTVTTDWHSIYRLPTTIAEPNRITSLTYDANGNLTLKRIDETNDSDGSLGMSAGLTGKTRTYTYTYNSRGQLLSSTGPRADLVNITTLTYDDGGNLATVTNGAGHVVTLSNYDANGHVGRIVDANGVTTDMIYGLRGQLISQSVRGGDGPTLTTTYDYDDARQLKTVTTPDNNIVRYTYDDAHWLTDISDNAGNTIHYVLDKAGNRVGETVTDPNGALARQITRAFDTLNRLKQVTGAAQ
ncbi:MAG: DUF6531 domain-containing protein [Pseudomonadota bacterium]